VWCFSSMIVSKEAALTGPVGTPVPGTLGDKGAKDRAFYRDMIRLLLRLFRI